MLLQLVALLFLPACYGLTREDLLRVTTAPDIYDLSNPFDRPPPNGIDPSFDCAWRKAAFAYSQHLQPKNPKQQAVADALQLSKCGSHVAPAHAPSSPPPPTGTVGKVFVPSPSAQSFFIDAVHGSDSNPGTMSQPFKTVERGVEASRGEGPGIPVTLSLRAGTYYLKDTLQLGVEDSMLTIQAYNGEQAIISGGVPLSLTWSAWKPTLPVPEPKTTNIYVADMSSYGLTEVLGLRVNGSRAVRARHPNANPEWQLFPTGWTKSAAWVPPRSLEPDSNIQIASPNRTFEQNMFEFFKLGVGGVCDGFTPSQGYWCSSDTEGGGAFTYRIPSGMQYKPSDLGGVTIQDPVGSVVQAWRPAHWASWMFLVDGSDVANHTVTWTIGGFQGARGSNEGAEWFIENNIQLLDNPNEFYYDAKAAKLYYYHNGTGSIPSTTSFVATRLKTLISVQAAPDNPANGVSFQGLTFEDASYTYLDPHGMPSGGDWALQRMGAVFLQGTNGTTIDSCLFRRLDGNGLMLSGYNRFATIENSEFVSIGDTALAAWGFTQGIDGTDGNQPRMTSVTNNFIHELGLYEKQSSCWFQAKTAQTILQNNICFNGPRAGFNINDGFGGGNVIHDNLGFNMCRESSDHSVINSWDRQPFLTKVRDGTPSLVPATNTIYRNFLVANYGADGGCVDNDDGSSWYMSYNNFFVFGGHKSDFAGHNKISTGNIDVYSSVYGPRCMGLSNLPLAGGKWNEGYHNVTCILADAGDPYFDVGGCKWSDKPYFSVTMGNNRLYAPSRNVSISLCGQLFNFDEWQKLGYDQGTTLTDRSTLSSADIIAMGKELLGW